MTPAVFLDRDGVLIEEVGHLRRPEQLRLTQGAAAAVAELRAAGLRVILVTNQSAVARGLLSEAELAAVHERLRALLQAEGAVLDDILYCPHHPTEGLPPYDVACACRKPAPGMLLMAQERHGLDLAGSFLVGDKRSDIGAARRAGCAAAILVRTGHGATEAAGPFQEDDRPDLICDDLTEAAAFILRHPASTSISGGRRAPGSP